MQRVPTVRVLTDKEQAFARAVLIGRPVFWGLAVDGELGVRNVLEVLRGELDSNMTLCGVADVENVSSHLVTTPSDWVLDKTEISAGATQK